MGKQKSDLSRAFSEDGARKTHVGGQALIEGVMMRGKFNWAVAVREPDGGIYTEEHDLASGKPKNSWMNAPLVRGCRALVESLVIGFKAIEIAAMHAYADEEIDEAGEGAAADARDGEVTLTRLDGTKTVLSGADDPETASADRDARVGEGILLERLDGETQVVSAPCAVSADAAHARREFSWKEDFGRPDTVIDGLGAQRSLDVVEDPAPAASGAATKASVDQAKHAESASEEGGFGQREMTISIVLGLVLGVVLFIVAPAAATNFIVGEYDSNPILWNVVDGVLRVAVFVFYIWLIGRMSDIKRMFGYHGAEHKTIHCYEHGLPLTPENARSFPRLHVRCGTAFLIMVMIIAIFVYTVIPVNLIISGFGIPDGLPKLLLVIVVRIVFMPVIAGISYEITVRWAGSHPDNPLVKVILWPGMQMQYLTTREPDDSMIECAIASMQMVLDREEAESRKAEGEPAAAQPAATAADAA